MSAAVDRSVRPASEAPRRLVLPRFESGRHPDPGGLDVRFARRRGVPEVSLRLILEAGAVGEPARHAGLAALTARLLTEGTSDRDAIEVARWLDRLGIGFHASAGHAVGVLSIHTLTDVFEEALEFLAAAARSPTFPDHEVDRVRQERLDEIAREIDEPAVVANHALIATLFGEGLYGRPVRGTHASVSAIEPDDIRAFHAARYRPGGGSLYVCGDVDDDRVRAGVEHWLGHWQGEARRPDAPVTPPAPEPSVLLIDRPGSAQAEVRVGAIGVPYGTPDHHAIVLANALLGGLFNSRINMNLREDKGWTYGARSSFRFRRGAGPFVVQTAVETGVTTDAIEEILMEIERMRNDLVTGDELDMAKHALALSLPLQFETPEQITARVSRQAIYDLGDDYWESYGARLEAVTAEDVREACRTYLARERLTLLAVTDAGAVAGTLSRLGPVERRSVDGTAIVASS